MAELAGRKPSERTIEMHDPGDEKIKIGVTVDIMSIDDERMKKAKRRIEDARLKLAAKGKTFSSEDIDANKNELYFTAMTGWNWGKDDDGEQATFHGEIPEFSRRVAHQVFEELPWFRDQIERELGETAEFFRKPK